MSTFAFKALDLTGTSTRGEIEADDKQSVAAQLRAKGLIVLDIEEQKPTDVGDLLGRFKKVKAHELTVATRQLSTMISSGMSLLRALYVLEDQCENDKLKDTWSAVRKDVEVGMSHLITGRWYLCIAICWGVVFAFRKWKNSERGREQWDRFKLKIPWKIGDTVQKIALARFSRTFSALVAAGVPMLEAIDITGRTSGNKVIEKAMHAVKDSVMGGGTVSAPMRTVPE